MKNFAIALALVLGIGVVVNVAQESGKTTAVSTLNAPNMKLHKELEAHRVSTAADISRHTVSVGIDYDRGDIDAGGSIMGRLGRMAGGVDPNDPFFRYDIGPFSGLVVSDHHVLISDRTLGDFDTEGAGNSVTAITVTLPNGQRWPGTVVGRQQWMDLALLELDCVITDVCPELAIAEIPDNAAPVKRGQFIMVVGRGQNPLGTLVNDGVVSAVDREKGSAFQIDARIGNSTLGAPVVDLHGHIVGIVTLHNHHTFGQASGVSYAAYLTDIRDAYETMKGGAFIERPPAPFMGIRTQKKWPDKPGLEIGSVVTDSGAEKADLRINDIILQVNGKDMNEVEDLITIINEHKVGDTLKVKFMRGKEEKTVDVPLGERP